MPTQWRDPTRPPTKTRTYATGAKQHRDRPHPARATPLPVPPLQRRAGQFPAPWNRNGAPARSDTGGRAGTFNAGHTTMRRVVAFLARLFAPRDVGPQRPRFVHRVTFTCPHSGQAVEADLLMGETGTLETMLRCSAQPACPPTCDQA